VKQIRKRLTYANVMSSIAVFMMLGGAAIAASQLPKNSVGTKQLKKNAVTTPKIKGQAVKAGKIANGAVLTDKIADLGVTTGKLADAGVTTGKIANDAVTGDKVAPNSLTGADINASTLGVVPEATVGSPRAYAYIGPGAAVRTDAPSKGITNANVTNPTAGSYCINGLPFTPQTAQVSGDTFGDNDNIIGVLVGTRNDVQCPGLEQVAVQNFDLGAAALENDEFFLVVW
jgi:hypothetical protein